jgi:uncharacterized membrane protein YhaH (DUF805 family)
MNFSESIKTCLTKKYFCFSGRASRSEFWFFYLFLLIGYIICFTLIMAVSFKLFWLMGAFMIGIILPSLGVGVRRLHDVNKSGWFLLLPVPFDIVGRLFEKSIGDMSLVFTIIGLGISIYLLVLYCTDGEKKNNRFGKNIYLKKQKKRKIKAIR